MLSLLRRRVQAVVKADATAAATIREGCGGRGDGG
jgi:hypothetical protein